MIKNKEVFMRLYETYNQLVTIIKKTSNFAINLDTYNFLFVNIEILFRPYMMQCKNLDTAKPCVEQNRKPDNLQNDVDGISNHQNRT